MTSWISRLMMLVMVESQPHHVMALFDSVEPKTKVAESAHGVLAGNGRNGRHHESGAIASARPVSPPESGIRSCCASIDWM
jgi:hypothetical protein